MGMASHAQPGNQETFVTGKSGGRIDNIFLQKDQSLRRLEGGSGRVRAHDSPVKQWFQGVFFQFGMILSALPSHQNGGVIAGCGNDAENFSCGGFYGDDSSQFVLHQFLCQLLQFNINAECQVLTGYGFFIQIPVFVMSLNTSVSIPQQYFNSLFATEVLLIEFLYALFANIIPPDIIIVFFNVFHRHFANITKGMGGRAMNVLPDGTPLNIKPLKFEQLFLKHPALLCR
ncbi:hypothetical protein EZS27_002838 [termite gut metagenome]|uniref:Uncharacterized protein n=1 Tax=termite gut metagenome TaxID=433724 RepID=A0A5J4SV22_9ZZZZ